MSFGGGRGGEVQRGEASFCLCFGRGARQELLLCCCVWVFLLGNQTVVICNQTVFFVGICTHSSKIMPEKKNCFTRNCRLDSEDWHSGGPICSESVVFSVSCVALCVCAPLSLSLSLLSLSLGLVRVGVRFCCNSLWCWSSLELDILLLWGALHPWQVSWSVWVVILFIPTFVLHFFSVSIYEESPRDKTYWTSTDTGV